MQINAVDLQISRRTRLFFSIFPPSYDSLPLFLSAVVPAEDYLGARVARHGLVSAFDSLRGSAQLLGELGLLVGLSLLPLALGYARGRKIEASLGLSGKGHALPFKLILDTVPKP